MKNSKTLLLTQTALVAVFITLCAWITIPAPVPFTMQTFGLYIALLLIGGRCTTIALSLYILMGVAGLPVFSSFGSSIGYITGPTGGYIIGFLLCSIMYFLSEKTYNRQKSQILSLITLLAGTMLCYLIGSLWFLYYTKNSLSISYICGTITVCVLPYVIPDIIKLMLAFILSKKLKKAINSKN